MHSEVAKANANSPQSQVPACLDTGHIASLAGFSHVCKEYMLSVPVLCLVHVSPLGIKLSNVLTSPKEHPIVDIVTQSPLQQNKSLLQILV